MTWCAYGASVRGTGHAKTGLPCQDAHDWRMLPDGIACAVADGLGSAARAQEGARIAVDQALGFLAPDLTALSCGEEKAIGERVRSAFYAARSALESAAGDDPLRDLGTTLLLAVATDEWTAVGQIGDGAVVGRCPDETLDLFCLPQRGEYANETVPLTADDALQHMCFRFWPDPMQALALLSDGLQGLAINLASGTPFAPFFDPFFAPVLNTRVDLFDAEATSERLAAFLDSERVRARTDDDKTLVVAARPVTE